jgi:hypothetical protein
MSVSVREYIRSIEIGMGSHRMQATYVNTVKTCSEIHTILVHDTLYFCI